MKQYKLIIDGQPSWTSFYIQAPNDRAARDRATRIVAAYGGHVAFTLTCGGGLVALADRAIGKLATALAPSAEPLGRTA